MKKIKVLAVLFFLFLTNAYSQENVSKPEIRLSYIVGSLGSVGQTYESIKYGASHTSVISGYDLKMIFPTKRANLQWLLGTFYQDGEELESNTLVGALYFGPQLSTSFKYVNFTAYISGGVFCVSDEVMVRPQNPIEYYSLSNYAAPGTKSGLGLRFSYKKVNLAGGYQIFMAAANKSAVTYHGLEFGIGMRF